jgi:hypothetical protein
MTFTKVDRCEQPPKLAWKIEKVMKNHLNISERTVSQWVRGEFPKKGYPAIPYHSRHAKMYNIEANKI